MDFLPNNFIITSSILVNLIFLVLFLSKANASKTSSHFPSQFPCDLNTSLLPTKGISRSLFFTVGKNEEFKTIQSAIDHANTQGGGTIYLEPGNYYENLTLYPGITLEGCGIADLRFVCIYGTHRLPEYGEFGFNHLLF